MKLVVSKLSKNQKLAAMTKSKYIERSYNRQPSQSLWRLEILVNTSEYYYCSII